MKSDTSSIQSHLDSEVTTLAWCWKATRRDGTMYGFTSHDQDLLIDGLIYYAETGLNATNAQAKVGTSVDNLEVGGMLDSTTISEDDLRSGLWDGCEIKVFIVNWKNTSQQLIIQVGTLGDVTVKKLQFVAEMRSLSQFLQNTIGRIITKRCDVDLGSTKCGINLLNYTRSDFVAIDVDKSSFVSSIDLTQQVLTPYNDPTEKLIMNMDSTTDLLGHTVTTSTIAPTIDNIVYKTASSSYLFSAANSTYLDCGNSTDYNITNQDFTIEASIYLTSHSSTGISSIITKDSSTTREFILTVEGGAGVSTSVVKLYLFTNNSSYTISSYLHIFYLNTMYDISVSRVAGTVYFHINGNYYVATTGGTNTTIVQAGTTNLRIGSDAYSGAENYFNGNIDNIRITIGASKYTTSNYVPNTSARAISQLIHTDHKITPFGKLTWLTGLNAGASMEVKSLAANTITLVLPMPNEVQIGDTFSVSCGCDKNFTSTTGCSSFSNQINFRGFPFIPGIDAIMEYPDAH